MEEAHKPNADIATSKRSLGQLILMCGAGGLIGFPLPFVFFLGKH